MQLTPNCVIQKFVSYFMYVYIYRGANQGYCTTTKFQHCPHGDPTKDIINSFYLYMMAYSCFFYSPYRIWIFFFLNFFFYDLAIGSLSLMWVKYLFQIKSYHPLTNSYVKTKFLKWYICIIIILNYPYWDNHFVFVFFFVYNNYIGTTELYYILFSFWYSFLWYLTLFLFLFFYVPYLLNLNHSLIIIQIYILSNAI